MFTGLVEDIGTILKIEKRGDSARFFIEAPFDLTDSKIGDSININGACLTITELKGKTLWVDVSPETMQRTYFKEVREGEKVNLERALKLGDRLGGHLVLGHIDGVGIISSKKREGNSILMEIEIPKNLSPYMAEKGSVALDGVSLTIASLKKDTIGVSIIPLTAQKTCLEIKNIGAKVNVEVDILGKYVERLLNKGKREPEGIDEDFLKEKGFL